MRLSREMRRLQQAWSAGSKWPKRLEWIEIHGLRGWTGQHIDVPFPVMAIVGENGSGKSTILQCMASVYRPAAHSRETVFASDHFPDTAWEKVTNAQIKYSYRQGINATPQADSVRKHTTRWRGQPNRPIRPVVYIDLKRLLPVADRTGYARIAQAKSKETDSKSFDPSRLDRLRGIMGKDYKIARLAVTDTDSTRSVPVLQTDGAEYSGFHQGAGETVLAELLAREIPQNSLVLIDEVETSLHPRAQRRLVADLAELARTLELQIVMTTHSPYVLAEIPREGRLYIINTPTDRRIVTGVSPEFAMTHMDEEPHPECDVYVEDVAAKAMLTEILIQDSRDLVQRCQITAFGAASVGKSLGQMVKENRFPGPTIVFLDGDQSEAPGCSLLPGGDAPEQVVFESLKGIGWGDVHTRVGRGASEVSDACARAMTVADHHDWIERAADELTLGGEILWQAMCASWANKCLDQPTTQQIATVVRDALMKGHGGYGGMEDAPGLGSGGQSAVRVGSSPATRIDKVPSAAMPQRKSDKPRRKNDDLPRLF